MIKLKIKYGNSQTDLCFPCTEKEMNAALERIHAEDVTPLELYVSEVIFPDELGCLQDRFVNLDEVNFLAKRMDSFFGDEEYQFYEARKLEGFDTLPDLINLSFNLNRYPLIRDIGDMGKIGREYLLTVNSCIPAHDEDDPKYARLGRELIQSGNGIFTEHGMLFVDENTPFQQSYDGQTFPAYLYDPGVLCVAKAEYGGKTEYLYFPCEEEAIDKAFARLGTTADEVKITLEDFNIDSPEWFGRFREIASEEGVYELNRLTAAVNTADMDLKKLWSVAEYAEAEDAEQLTSLMRRRHDSRCKCQERWTCENKECRLRIEISDAELLTALSDLLSTVTADSISLPAEKPYEPSTEAIRLNNEISRMLDAAEIDKAILRNKMTECISQKYSELGNECCTAHKLKAELGSLSDVTERLNRTVSEIRLHPDKTADLILLNGQIIRKEKIHATDSGRSTEGGAGNRTDHIGQGEHQKPLSSLACCSILPSFHEARGTTQQL